MNPNHSSPSYHPMISQSPCPVIPSPVLPNSPTSSSAAALSPMQNPLFVQKLVKKQRHNKGEYRRKLKDENSQLKKQIKELELKINTQEAENNALQNQIQFFQQYVQSGSDNVEPTAGNMNINTNIVQQTETAADQNNSDNGNIPLF